VHDLAKKSLLKSPATTTKARLPDGLAVAILVAVAFAITLTFRDYGLGWDDYTHSQYGSLLIDLYRSGFADRRALSFVNLYMYGGGFDMLATLAGKLLPFDPFATRRLVGGLVGLIGLAATWRLGRRLGGPTAGLVALLLLAACPLYYGHMLINAKDGPFAAVMAVALLGIVRAFEEYPRVAPSTVALCGIGIGLAIGSRVLGGFAVIEAVIPLAMIVGIRVRATGAREALRECGRFIVRLIPGIVLAYLIMALVWPWSVISPLNPFRAVEYFSNFFEKPWRELLDGTLIPVIDMPRSYVPTLMAVQLPELMLILGIGGLVCALVVALRPGERDALGVGRRAALFATVLAAALPVAITVATRPAMYNGIRHFIFVLPPLAALGGFGAALVARRLAQYGKPALAAGALALIAGIALPVVEMARLHPYQYTYFNRLAGGVPGARQDFMLDYWGLSLTQASRDLIAEIARRGETPAHPPWSVAVCGPHPPVAVALGPGFTTTWNPKNADFAMTLGEFYCAKLDAPVLFDVVREGVVYARLYDLRGRSVPTLLTVPGIDQTDDKGQ
jgi:hypothetical protein